MNIDYATKVQGTLMDDLGKGVSLEKAVQVKIDNLGFVKSHTMFVKNIDHLEWLRQRYEIQ